MSANNITGFTCSSWDLLHSGHILMLREAKTQCEYLICGLQTDPTVDRDAKNKPLQTITERYIQLQAVVYVDEIIVYETEADLLNILNGYPIDIRILGEEYKDTAFTGSDLDMQFYFNKRDHEYSTSRLRGLIK